MPTYEYRTEVLTHGFLGRKEDGLRPRAVRGAPRTPLGGDGWEFDKLFTPDGAARREGRAPARLQARAGLRGGRRMTEPSHAAADPGRAAVSGGEPEVVLAGGNMTPVVRAGDTVRRRAGPWTPTIHALLRHVRAAGFTQVPEPLGLDADGREILSLLPGRVATYPLPAFVLSGAMLATVARTLRAYHDATAGSRVRRSRCGSGRPRSRRRSSPQRLRALQPHVRGHRAHRRDRLRPRLPWPARARPGLRRLPLRAAHRPGNPDVPYPGADAQAARLGAFCRAYGMAGIAPADVVDSAAESCASW